MARDDAKDPASSSAEEATDPNGNARQARAGQVEQPAGTREGASGGTSSGQVDRPLSAFQAQAAPGASSDVQEDPPVAAPGAAPGGTTSVQVDRSTIGAMAIGQEAQAQGTVRIEHFTAQQVVISGVVGSSPIDIAVPGVQLASIRRDMLAANSVRQLQECLYRLNAMLAKQPHNVEALLLRDQIEDAIRAVARRSNGPFGATWTKLKRALGFGDKRGENVPAAGDHEVLASVDQEKNWRRRVSRHLASPVALAVQLCLGVAFFVYWEGGLYFSLVFWTLVLFAIVLDRHKD